MLNLVLHGSPWRNTRSQSPEIAMQQGISDLEDDNGKDDIEKLDEDVERNTHARR